MPVYTARHVLPIAAPPIADGAVAVKDKLIVARGPRNDLLKDFEGEPVRDLGDAVLIPGLVNAHTHLELSWMGENRPPGGDFLTWLRGFVERRDAEDEGLARNAAVAGIEAAVARGTVAVGDISNRVWMPGVLAASSLWGVLFHELFGFVAGRAEPAMDEAAARLDAMEADLAPAEGRLTLALTPHAPHTTSAALIKALAGRAVASDEPLTIHVAESEVEVDFLAGRDDEFRRYLATRGMWDEGWTAPRQTPVEYLDRQHALFPKTLAVHCVHITPPDLQRLQTRGATVVTCPRSNDYMGVGRAPVMDLLRAGIPVALGTDSLASAPDLDPFGELAALVELHEGLAPAAALRMATLNGARALGLADRLGSIEPGKLAGLVVVPLAAAGDDPFETLASVPDRIFRLEDAPFEEA